MCFKAKFALAKNTSFKRKPKNELSEIINLKKFNNIYLFLIIFFLIRISLFDIKTRNNFFFFK